MTNLQRLQAAKSLYCQLLVTVQLAAAVPTQANVDAAISAVNAGTYAGALALKPSTSQDGESYDWVGYANMLTEQVAKLNDLISRESMPWIARGRARP